MSKERAELIEWLRGEIVGPGVALREPDVIAVEGDKWLDPKSNRNGPLQWRPKAEAPAEEVLYYRLESPHRKYGIGCLHPEDAVADIGKGEEDETALEGTSTDIAMEDPEELMEQAVDEPLEDETDDNAADEPAESVGLVLYRPSSIAISVALRIAKDGAVQVKLPASTRFAWQQPDALPIAVNGCYRRLKRHQSENKASAPAWGRHSVVPQEGFSWEVSRSQLESGNKVRTQVAVADGVPVKLELALFPRRIKERPDDFIVTVVLRNRTRGADAEREGAKKPTAMLFQAYFEVAVRQGVIHPYPESERPFGDLDEEEQSLALLYRESAVYGIGHGCAAGWHAEPGQVPEFVFADVFPAVELPSMTPDVEVDGQPLKIAMRDLMALSDDGSGTGWSALHGLLQGYRAWIEVITEKSRELPPRLQLVAKRHIERCGEVYQRMERGLALLRDNEQVRQAFRSANRAMLLQQIATKYLKPGQGDGPDRLDPLMVLEKNMEGPGAGYWRAFQVAFLLMSMSGLHDEGDHEREIVDVIWFPTGGGKTEAYLVVVAFVLFIERLRMKEEGGRRDGTNVLMRYTLRMLTTQQFQRASALVCAMEAMRRHPSMHDMQKLPGGRFSLGLWLGGEGSPNWIEDASHEVSRYRKGKGRGGNPLVLTECPWCRSAIGLAGRRGKSSQALLKGISEDNKEGPRLLCPQARCEFGKASRDSWLPVEVIDERIYLDPPSLVIGTVDKFAMLTYRPDSRALFGLKLGGGAVSRVAHPPSLIVQDELHLITAALGTMYAVYEPIIHELCALHTRAKPVYPKIIASTATLRGAQAQVQNLYGRHEVQVFPAPGLTMGDSFFGVYARAENKKLLPGRLYLGLHAENYGSVLTTQTRAFAALLARPWWFSPDMRDPWVTLLAFYNSIRELGGAKTLFDSDIRSRLKNLFNREASEEQGNEWRRKLRVVEELTSRLSQPEIVAMLERLSTPYVEGKGSSLDACLATNIIEVGVDIERLSLMGVTGQPKGNASYIQVTGRVGRRWFERPGLIVTIYNPSRSRDRSHYEQFHGYHRRLYERVEPASVTPFAGAALERAAAGAILAWVRQNTGADVNQRQEHCARINEAAAILARRCRDIEHGDERSRALALIEDIAKTMIAKWHSERYDAWEGFPQNPDLRYVMLWPGQFSTAAQRAHGSLVPSSMRHVDRQAELAVAQPR